MLIEMGLHSHIYNWAHHCCDRRGEFFFLLLIIIFLSSIHELDSTETIMIKTQFLYSMVDVSMIACSGGKTVITMRAPTTINPHDRITQLEKNGLCETGSRSVLRFWARITWESIHVAKAAVCAWMISPSL